MSIFKSIIKENDKWEVIRNNKQNILRKNDAQHALVNPDLKQDSHVWMVNRGGASQLVVTYLSTLVDCK